MMELRKAIEKAKQERERTGSTAQQNKAKAPVHQAVQKNTGWTPPDYLESKSAKLNTVKAEENKCAALFSDSVAINYYKVLKTRIQHCMQANGWNTIMITSVNPGEGKTLTSINLAITMAMEFNQTVLLVDTDLHHQNIHKYLGVPSNIGLIDYLENNTPLKKLIIWPGIEKLTFISGGKNVLESSELLGSPKMKNLVEEMKKRYDERYIIFDMPPVLGNADTITFAPMVDCTLMVVEEGKTTIQDVKKAVDLLPQNNFIGYVLNKQTASINKRMKYGYGYV
ncbi:MAG: polysaccharide biosynthesis tyrosine autokinase [Deltaproteobacteria bacterium]|nr:polysaccharide biosynthesis tyrosine autokinase [Deltaproteobacteria bacterium]